MVILTLDKKLRNKEFEFDEWYLGELPIFKFANSASPWCLCQDYASSDSIEIKITKIDDSSAELKWKSIYYDVWVNINARVNLKDGKWKISYLPGFDYEESIKSDGEI